MPIHDRTQHINLFLAAIDNDAMALRYAIERDPALKLDKTFEQSDLDDCSPDLQARLSPYPFNGLAHVAAIAGSTEFLRELLSHTDDADSLSAEGQTPMALAVKHGRTAILRLLLDRPDRGQMLRFRDILNRNFLHVAARNGDAETARLLLDAGLCPEETDITGWPPVAFAIWPQVEGMAEGDRPALLRLLMQHRSWSRVRDLQMIQVRGKIGTQHPETLNGTWLHTAARVGNLQAIDLLIADGFDVNVEISPKDGKPMHYACASHQAAAVHLLAQRGADLDAYWEGRSLLAIATENQVESKCIETVATLLDLGCDPTVADERGTVPIDIAKGCPQVLALYRAHASRNAIQETLQRSRSRGVTGA